jgi:membrane protein implicated in regulation of membrane protease activity
VGENAGVKRPPLSRAALFRYWAFQAPGFALAAGLSFAAWEWFAVPAWAALAALALWVAKDAVMARFLAHAYEPHGRGGPHDLVGRRGVAETTLAPEGTVRIGAERWRAECAHGVAHIEQGAAVRVVSMEGLRVVVQPE